MIHQEKYSPFRPILKSIMMALLAWALFATLGSSRRTLPKVETLQDHQSTRTLERSTGASADFEKGTDASLQCSISLELVFMLVALRIAFLAKKWQEASPVPLPQASSEPVARRPVTPSALLERNKSILEAASWTFFSSSLFLYSFRRQLGYYPGFRDCLKLFFQVSAKPLWLTLVYSYCMHPYFIDPILRSLGIEPTDNNVQIEAPQARSEEEELQDAISDLKQIFAQLAIVQVVSYLINKVYKAGSNMGSSKAVFAYEHFAEAPDKAWIDWVAYQLRIFQILFLDFLMSSFCHKQGENLFSSYSIILVSFVIVGALPYAFGGKLSLRYSFSIPSLGSTGVDGWLPYLWEKVAVLGDLLVGFSGPLLFFVVFGEGYYNFLIFYLSAVLLRVASQYTGSLLDTPSIFCFLKKGLAIDG